MDDATNSDVESTAFDKFLGVYVMLPGGDSESKVLARVKDQKRDHDGALIRKTQYNPILNTSVYNVETPDGHLQNYTANVIAEKLWNQVDDDGNNYDNLYEIIGHRKNDDAIDEANGFYETNTGAKRRVILKKGWDFQIKWESGDTTFIALEDIKETNPVEISEYVLANQLEKEPAFAWWIRTALKRRDTIISKVSMRVRKKMKFGIHLPAMYEEAVRMDKESGNKFWQDATKK